MKNRKIMYVAITIFCIFAIAFGVYDQFFNPNKKVKKTKTVANETTQNTVEPKPIIDTSEELKKKFNKMFKNEINLNGFNSSQIPKINENEEIVYTVESIKQEKADKYEMNINIPAINIQSDVVNEFNKITLDVFVKKATEIMQKLSENTNSEEQEESQTENEEGDNTVYTGAEESENVNNTNNNKNRASEINVTIYNVDYTAFVNKNILSVVIKATLKEGESSQRVIVQTYNYNLASGQKVEFVDALQSKNIQVDTAENEIKQCIEEHSEYTQSLEETGNNIYKRDVENKMYTASKTENFFLDENSNLYAIYAYGNDNETTEMDIVEIK